MSGVSPGAHIPAKNRTKKGDASCDTTTNTRTTAFKPTCKRRKGYLSETNVKRGIRVIHRNKDLHEKLGRNDLCPCGSGRKFQKVLPPLRPL
jgi:uncharacterized protein YecA (UPF0149 family)